jgi:BASS family bile acid:Na+ symporter
MDQRKFTLLSLSQFIHHHLLWLLISSYVTAAIFPTAGLWIRSVSFGDVVVFQTTTHVPLLLVLLATSMFNAGLGVKTSHLKSLMKKIWVLVADLTANGFGVARARFFSPHHGPDHFLQLGSAFGSRESA